MAKALKLKLFSGDLKSHDDAVTVAMFKLKGKKYRSASEGYVAINKDDSSIYMGFDRDQDGFIAEGHQEAFAHFVIQLDPFSESKSSAEKLADKFSRARARGKMKFKPLRFSDEVFVIDGHIDRAEMTFPTKVVGGQGVSGDGENGAYEYSDFFESLTTGTDASDLDGGDETPMQTMFKSKRAAKKAAKNFECKGAHKMGDLWMVCNNHADMVMPTEDHSDHDHSGDDHSGHDHSGHDHAHHRIV